MTGEKSADTATKKKKFFKFNFKDMPLSTKVWMGVFAVIVGIMLFIYAWTFLVDRTFLTNIIIRFFVNPVKSIGFLGYPLYLFFMFVQTIIAPIPSEVVQMTAGMLWGFWVGFLLSFVGIMGSSVVSFYISRRGGRAIVEGTIGLERLKGIDYLMERYGLYAIIGMRAIPFIPFDLGSYAAGLVDISWKDYLIGTAIGASIRSAFYAFIGSKIFSGGVDELIRLLKTNPKAFDVKLHEVAPRFNLILIITLVSVGALVALMQFVILPRFSEKLQHEGKVDAHTKSPEKSGE